MMLFGGETGRANKTFKMWNSKVNTHIQEMKRTKISGMDLQERKKWLLKYL
jgi:hypothetical protein